MYVIFVQSYGKTCKIANLCLFFWTSYRTFVPRKKKKVIMLKHTFLVVVGIGGICLCSFLASCSENKKNEQPQRLQWSQSDELDEIISLPPLSYRASAVVAGKQLTYEYRMEAVDSLPVIVNVDGIRYYDNAVNLTIWSESSEILLNRKFLKKDFARYVNAENMKCLGLVGFSINPETKTDSQVIHFIATVGDPDETSGVNFPVDICVDAVGHISMKPAENTETAPLNSELSQGY